MSRRIAFVLFALVSLLLPSGAGAQNVVRRARIGNNIEDITFISTGPLQDNIAIMNGYEIYLAPLHPRGGKKAPSTQTKLFDVRSTPIGNGPRGLAYIPSQRLLAFHSGDSGTLYLVDSNGVFQGTRPMVFPGAAAATYLEGMDYLPRSSSLYPDHLIVAANTFTDPSLTPRIEVVRLDGTVEAEIVPQPFANGSFVFDPRSWIAGLAYKAPDQLLVNLFDGTDNVWALDFNGNVVGSGPVYPGTTHLDDEEGIVQFPDGRVVVSGYATGKLLFFDRNMNRLPADDRTYSVGLGISHPTSLTWDTDTNSHLLLHFFPPSLRLSAVSSSLDSASSVALGDSLAGSRLAYLPGDHLVATLARRRIPTMTPPLRTFVRLYDPTTGFFSSEVDITLALAGGTAVGWDYIPSTDQFAVGVSGGATPNTLKIVTRAGVFVRSIDLSATGLATPSGLAYFDPLDPSGDRFLILGAATSGRSLVVTDFNGNVLTGGFDARAGLNLLHPFDLSTISTSADAGSFGVVDVDNSELVVFKLP